MQVGQCITIGTSSAALAIEFEMKRLPISRTPTERNAVVAIRAMTAFAPNTAMPMDMTAPVPIWIKPRRADALPTLREKGANAMAAALGYVSPMQDRKTKNRISVGNIVNQ